MSYDREPANMTEMGPKAYKKKIANDNKISAGNRDLPYKFSKTKKGKPSKAVVECSKCGKVLFGTEDSILVVCGGCGVVVRIKNRCKKERI